MHVPIVYTESLLREAREFSSKPALERYLEDHPKADPSNHWVAGDKKKESPKDDNSKDDIKLKVAPKKVEQFKHEIPEYKLEIIAGEGGTISEKDLKRAKAIRVQLQRGIQAAADICQMNPSVCEQNLGISRSHMPQIMEESIKQLLKSDKESDRRKGQAAVDAGADPDDDRPMTSIFMDWLKEKDVNVKKGEKVSVGQLKATQREIKAGKTFGMANAYFEGEYDPTKKPIIVSSDNHILDGHHRWAAMLTADPEAKMNVIRIDMPMRDILEKSFDMPGVFRADLQDNIIGKDDPLDLGRAPGDSWKQSNGKWYAKNLKGDISGPFKSKESADDHAKGKKAASVQLRVAVRYLATYEMINRIIQRHIDREHPEFQYDKR